MKLPVCGFDPSLRNWGMASATLDLDTGELSTPFLSLVQTGLEPKNKQVRVNSYDIDASEELYKGAMAVATKARIVFVEVPHGSQSASGMKGYGICIGILGSMRANGIQIIEVSAEENKKVFTGKRTATKDDMIQKAMELYPDANWPMHNKKLSATKAEHVADAIAAIHSGVNTPAFKNLMSLLSNANSTHAS